MTDFPAALDAALRAHFHVTEVKTPITQRRGLTARMNQIERLFTRKGDRPGAAGRRAAEAAGISPGTWRKWRKGAAKPATTSQRKLEKAYDQLVNLPKMRRTLAAKGIPDKVNVTAYVVWNREYTNRTPHRTIRLRGMHDIMKQVIRIWRREGPQQAATLFQDQAPLVLDACDAIEFQYDGVQPVRVEFP